MDSARPIRLPAVKNCQNKRIVLMEALDILLKSKKIILSPEDKKLIEWLKSELRNFNEFKKYPDFDPDKLLAIFKRYHAAIASYDIVFQLKREKSNDSFYVFGTSQNEVIDAISEEHYYMLVRRYQYFNEFKHGKSFNIYKCDELPDNIILTERSKIAWERGADAQGYVACVYPDKDNPGQWVIDMAPAFNGIVTEEDKDSLRDKYGVKYKDDEYVYSEEQRGGNTGTVHRRLKSLYHLEGVQPILGFGIQKYGLGLHGLSEALLYIQSGNMNEPNINRNPEQLMCFWFLNGIQNYKADETGHYNQFFVKRSLPRELVKKISTALVAGLLADKNVPKRDFKALVSLLINCAEIHFMKYDNHWRHIQHDPALKCKALLYTMMYSLGIGLDKKGIPLLDEVLFYLELNCKRIVDNEFYWYKESDKEKCFKKLRNELLCGQHISSINIAEELIKAGKLEALKSLFKIISDGDKIAKYTDIADDRGNTPFMIAVKSRKLDIIDYLVTQNPSIELNNETGHAAIRLALEKNHLDLATKLMVLIIKEKTYKSNRLLGLLEDFSRCVIEEVENTQYTDSQITAALKTVITQTFMNDKGFNAELNSALTHHMEDIQYDHWKYLRILYSTGQVKISAENLILLEKLESQNKWHEIDKIVFNKHVVNSYKPLERDRFFAAVPDAQSRGYADNEMTSIHATPVRLR